MARKDFQSGRPEPRRRPVKRPQRPAKYDDSREARDDPLQTLLPYKNFRALAAYYCGIFTLVPAGGLVIGPVAVVLGILGYRYGQLHPTAKGTGHAVAGIVFGIIGFIINVVGCYLVARYALRLDGGKTIPYRGG
jgi:hypothetical protein